MGTITSSGVIPYKAKVDSQGRLITFSAIEAEDRHININTGKVWSVDLDEVLTNASTKATPLYVAYFENTSQVPYHMTDMRAHCLDVASIVDVDEVTVGTIGNHTSFLPNQVASRHVGISANPIGDMASATTATGLTGLTKVANLFHAGSIDNKTSHLRTTSNVIIPPGSAVAIAVRGANATNGVTFTWSLVEVPHEVV
jgi:hypothetical protein